jgi:hypothetical protein
MIFWIHLCGMQITPSWKTNLVCGKDTICLGKNICCISYTWISYKWISDLVCELNLRSNTYLIYQFKTIRSGPLWEILLVYCIIGWHELLWPDPTWIDGKYFSLLNLIWVNLGRYCLIHQVEWLKYFSFFPY